MKHPVSRELHAYWDRLRGARAAPERGDVDPAAIRTILADTFLLEVSGGPADDDRDVLVRLSGTRLNAIWGADLKGRSLLSLFRSDDEAALRALVALVLEDRVPVVAGANGWNGLGPVEFEMLLLPLRHQGKTHVRLIGSLVPLRPPAGLEARPAGELTLTSFRSIKPLGTTPFRAPEAALAARRGDPVRYGRFVVHDGGR